MSRCLLFSYIKIYHSLHSLSSHLPRSQSTWIAISFSIGFLALFCPSCATPGRVSTFITLLPSSRMFHDSLLLAVSILISLSSLLYSPCPGFTIFIKFSPMVTHLFGTYRLVFAISRACKTHSLLSY